MLNDIVDAGYLPKRFRHFQQKSLCCWDIETLESQNIPESNLDIQAALNVVSIR